MASPEQKVGPHRHAPLPRGSDVRELSEHTLGPATALAQLHQSKLVGNSGAIEAARALGIFDMGGGPAKPRNKHTNLPQSSARRMSVSDVSPRDRRRLVAHWKVVAASQSANHTALHGHELGGEELLQSHRSILDAFEALIQEQDPGLWARLGGALPIWDPSTKLPDEFSFASQSPSTRGRRGIDWKIPSHFTLEGGAGSELMPFGEFHSLHELPSLEELGKAMDGYIHGEGHVRLGGEMEDAATAIQQIAFAFWHLLLDDIRLDWLQTDAGKAAREKNPPFGWTDSSAHQQ